MTEPLYTAALPLNKDARWVPIDRLFERLLARPHAPRDPEPRDIKTVLARLRSHSPSRHHDHVLRELEQKLARGRVRVALQSVFPKVRLVVANGLDRLALTYDFQPVAPARWVDELGLDHCGSGVVVMHRATGQRLVSALHIWAPDVAAVWPEAAAIAVVNEPQPLAPAKPMTAKERAAERDRRVREVGVLLRKKTDLAKVEVRETQKGKVDCFGECQTKIPDLTRREFLDGLRAERERRRALKQKPKRKNSRA